MTEGKGKHPRTEDKEIDIIVVSIHTISTDVYGIYKGLPENDTRIDTLMKGNMLNVTVRECQLALSLIGEYDDPDDEILHAMSKRKFTKDEMVELEIETYPSYRTRTVILHACE